MAAEKLQATAQSAVVEVLEKFETEILANWVSEQMAATTMRRDLLKESQLWDQSRRFLSVLRAAVRSGSIDITSAPWSPVCDVLGELSREQATQGFTPRGGARAIDTRRQVV